LEHEGKKGMTHGRVWAAAQAAKRMQDRLALAKRLTPPTRDALSRGPPQLLEPLDRLTTVDLGPQRLRERHQSTPGRHHRHPFE
jgi:hypothetical protein